MTSILHFLKGIFVTGDAVYMWEINAAIVYVLHQFVDLSNPRLIFALFYEQLPNDWRYIDVIIRLFSLLATLSLKI